MQCQLCHLRLELSNLCRSQVGLKGQPTIAHMIMSSPMVTATLQPILVLLRAQMPRIPKKSLVRGRSCANTVQLTEAHQLVSVEIGMHQCMHSTNRPEIGYEDGRRFHSFRCAAWSCKQRVHRYLDKKDGKSTGNLRKHAKSCWGAEAVEVAEGVIFSLSAYQDRDEVRPNLTDDLPELKSSIGFARMVTHSTLSVIQASTTWWKLAGLSTIYHRRRLYLATFDRYLCEQEIASQRCWMWASICMIRGKAYRYPL